MKYPKTVIFLKEFQPEMVVSGTNDRKNSKQLHISQPSTISLEFKKVMLQFRWGVIYESLDLPNFSFCLK